VLTPSGAGQACTGPPVLKPDSSERSAAESTNSRPTAWSVTNTRPPVTASRPTTGQSPPLAGQATLHAASRSSAPEAPRPSFTTPAFSTAVAA